MQTKNPLGRTFLNSSVVYATEVRGATEGRSDRILPSSRCMSTGFVSKSEQPTSTLLARSLASAWAVSAMMGMADVAGLALICCVASQPSISPSATSIRIISGNSLAAMSTPAAPSQAQQTEKPFRSRRRVSMSRFISLSSTSRILCIGDSGRHGQNRVGEVGNERRRQVKVGLSPTLHERHADREAAALSEFAFHGDFAAHQLAKPLAERQSKPSTAILAGAGVVGDAEFIE